MRNTTLSSLAVLVAGVCGAAGLAAAGTDDPGPEAPPPPVDMSTFVGSPGGPGGFMTGYIFTDDPPSAEHGLNSRILYLNNCKGETGSTGQPGCRLTRGSPNDSRINRSSIASGNLAAYSGSDSTWNQIVACVRATYAPFNITVVTTDPGNVPHFETMAAGLPGNIGFSNGVAGVSPFSCGIIDNSISFNFINLFPNDVEQACWTIAQETAHSFGLSHSMLASDPMTYIPNPPLKRFQNQSACIGTQGCCQPAQECQCGVPGNMQNSYQRLLNIFGMSVPTPPEITIDQPFDGAPVTPGFVVRVTVTDDQGVDNVQLLVDDNPVGSIITPPYAFNAPMSLTNGPHTVTVRATDILQVVGTKTISVMVGEPCGSDAACAAVNPDLVCVDGRCVPGESTSGGLGTSCTTAGECFSGLCATKGDRNLCTESCDLAANACPDNYECLSNGAGGGLCWPSEGGCLGCSTDGGAPQPALPIAAGLFVAAVLVRRRRRRATAV